MAIDTLAKRNSALNVSGVVIPIPDGAIDTGDRQTLLTVYSGILATTAAIVKKAFQTLSIRIGISL